MLTASAGNSARLWDVATGKELAAQRGLILGAELSDDGERVLTVSEDDTARLWDAVSGKELRACVGMRA